ncbi:BTB/POZ and MATH domain-containing protein 2-like [Miscanthus floridulus]|uniref:BTB/POZ and MATH domain-containing protein 2-like n=1 Tax=Miscanthus floridulus TaxID=154761 RepID=UPI003458AA37
MARTEIPIPPSDFTMHLGKLLEDKKGADVTFVVEGQNFDAHKAVLAARSPVFMEKFYGSMTREIGTGSVTVEDMIPLVFKTLLHFVYTDMLPETLDSLGHDYVVIITKLLVAADTYAMDRLKLMCESILAKKLSIENFDEFVDIAQRHSGHKLKEVCIEFMASQSERDFTQTC